MTIAYGSLVAAIFLPYIFIGYAKVTKSGFVNKNVRIFLENLEGKKKRAYWAHLNQFESFPPFAAGVIVAHQMNAPQHLIDSLALIYLVFRVAYFFCYLYDKNSARSIMWLGGILAVFALFFVGVG